MAWKVVLAKSVVGDLQWFGAKEGRKVLAAAQERLTANPCEDSRNMKSLRPNPVAQREVRLFGKYRLLFNLEESTQTVTIVLAGEKRGNALLVRGKEFQKHHESDPSERSEDAAEPLRPEVPRRADRRHRQRRPGV